MNKGGSNMFKKFLDWWRRSAKEEHEVNFNIEKELELLYEKSANLYKSVYMGHWNKVKDIKTKFIDLNNGDDCVEETLNRLIKGGYEIFNNPLLCSVFSTLHQLHISLY